MTLSILYIDSDYVLIDKPAGMLVHRSRIAQDQVFALQTLRDQIGQLQHVQASQGIEGVSGDLDILAAKTAHGRACVQVLFVRGARVLGSKTYYPPLKLDEDAGAVLAAGRSPGEHEESLSWVSIPFSSIVSIEARKPDAPATIGATLAVLVGAGLLGVTVIAIAFATSGGFY